MDQDHHILGDSLDGWYSLDLGCWPSAGALEPGRSGLINCRAPVSPIPEVAYGSHIEARGHLQEPSDIGEFDFKQDLARQDIHSQMSWPEVEVISEGHGSIFYRAIYALKSGAQIAINSLLPDPQAALLPGILLGNDKGIPPELADDFRTTGLTHIIAISGLKCMMIAK
jgi:competence protein ComEC